MAPLFTPSFPSRRAPCLLPPSRHRPLETPSHLWCTAVLLHRCTSASRVRSFSKLELLSLILKQDILSCFTGRHSIAPSQQFLRPALFSIARTIAANPSIRFS